MINNEIYTYEYSLHFVYLSLESIPWYQGEIVYGNRNILSLYDDSQAEFKNEMIYNSQKLRFDLRNKNVIIDYAIENILIL